MDLVSGQPWWPLAAGVPASYPALAEAERCDVAIVGAGITGALLADAFSAAGADVCVLDRRPVACGSTAASTALLSLELDHDLCDLIPRVGESAAVRAFQLGAEAIARLERLSGELGEDCGFSKRASLYLASNPADAARLEREAACRARHGIPGEFWDRRRIRERYELAATGAVRTELAGELDPYRFTHRLLARAAGRGCRLHADTELLGWERRRGRLQLATSRGPGIRAELAVLAPGYELPLALRGDLMRLSSTYVIVTEPLADFSGWEDRCLLWETARPYHYARTTRDGRVIFGGADEPFVDAASRDALLPAKAGELGRALTRLLPASPTRTALAWTGTFGETGDGLAHIGALSNAPGLYLALGYGGNGITFAVSAADILLDLCMGRPNPDAALFRPDRVSAREPLRASS